MDIKSRELWIEYSKAKDVMFAHTHTPEAPWSTIESDDKKRARLNCIAHLLDSIEYNDVLPGPIHLGERASGASYDRPPKDKSTLVPERY